MKANILICAKKECTGNTIDLHTIKSHFENKGHEVLIYNDFCEAINNTDLVAPFASLEHPVVFAGCSPPRLGNPDKIYV